MNPFSELLSHWTGFYQLAGTASATLAGLLFVMVSLHIDLLAQERSKVIRALARQTLTNFMYILVISLMFQVLFAGPVPIGLLLLAIGLLGTNEEVRLGLQIRQQNRSEAAPMPRRQLVGRLVLPTASYAIILVIGVALLLGQIDALPWMVAAIILLLLNATINSWDMLIYLAVLKENINKSQPPANNP